MNQATELIANMKLQNSEFDEDITNMLLEGYGKQKYYTDLNLSLIKYDKT